MKPATIIRLPTLHPGQVRAFMLPARHKAIRCGRRWGKTEFLKTLAGDQAIKGFPIGWFAPDYKRLGEAYSEVRDMLEPITKAASENKGVIRLRGGGRIDFWTLEDENAGRSRKYKWALIDEGAFTKDKNMMKIWDSSISPTLLDYKGRAIVASNTNGLNRDNFFWRICNEPQHGFKDFHAPTHDNPFMPADELEKLRLSKPPLVYKQEYLADFVDWTGVQFFSLANLMQDGEAVPWPDRCDAVFATIDTAVKTGKTNDATAVVYWAFTAHKKNPLVILDYDIVQIEGALLEAWLPNVFLNLKIYAEKCGSRSGATVGAHIEDKASGMILLQQAANRGWGAHAIDSKLTALGKDERAISVSGYVYQGMVRISQPAYDKLVVYKEQQQNHLVTQVLGYRVGVRDQQEDDLLDAFCYGVAIALGNPEGF